MPLSLVRPTDRRMLLRSLLRATAMSVTIKPVFQKSRTLFRVCLPIGPAER